MKKYKLTPPSNKNLKNGGSIKTYLGNEIYPLYRYDTLSEPDLKGVSTLQPVPEDESTLEAEKGETAYLPDVQGLAAHYKVGGKRHSAGGTPLSLPDNSFIFSDTSDMKIKDPEILKHFGKIVKENNKKGFTPADLAKKYGINKYRLILADPNSDDTQRSTAESMIGNYNIKLGKLALVQESKKGFPTGIPEIALPYLATTGIDPQDVLPLRHPGSDQPTQEPSTIEAEQAMGKYGMQVSKLMQPGGQPDNSKLFIRPDINTTQYIRDPKKNKGVSSIPPFLLEMINAGIGINDLFNYQSTNPNQIMIPVGNTPVDSSAIVNDYLKQHENDNLEDLTDLNMNKDEIKKYQSEGHHFIVNGKIY